VLPPSVRAMLPPTIPTRKSTKQITLSRPVFKVQGLLMVRLAWVLSWDFANSAKDR
jgi:hypothetical protein